MSVRQQQSGLPPRLQVLQQALHALQPSHRRVRALRFLPHRSTAEIALTLHCTEANVKILQSQALLELQRTTTTTQRPEPPQRSRAA